MVQPIDYSLNVKSPFEMAMYGRGQALQQNIMEQQLEAARQQEAARQKEAQATAAMRADFAAFAEKKDKTDNDYRGMMEKYPDMAKNIDMAFANKTAEQKRNTLDQSLPIRAALKNNNPEKAIEQVINLAAAQRNSGFEDQAQKTEAMISTIKGSPEGALDSINMTIAHADPELFKLLMEQEKIQKEKTEGGKVQSSEILPDGSSILVTSDKKVIVKNPEGDIVTGKDAAKVVRKGREYGIDIAEMKKAAVTGAGEAIKTGTKYIEQIGKINENIGDIQEAINIVDEGIRKGEDLGIGPIRKYLPAFSRAAKNLEAVGNRLGLGVVNSATFGALSEKELEFARDTALPKGMKPEALKQWLTERRDAREKLANYLTDAAIFIGSPKEDGTGVNTARDWIKLQRDQGKQTVEAAKPEGQKQPATITNKAQFDALPSGTVYISKDGKKYRKP